MHRIKCGHCSTTRSATYHTTSQEVRECAFRAARAASQAQKVATVRSQIVPTRPRPNTWQFKTPRVMVEQMREGRYAVEVTLPGQPTDWVFVRVSRPTRGKKAGCLVLQTQHSDYYKPLLTIYPSGSVYFFKASEKLDMALMMIAADPYTSAINYGRELGCCSRCARELTDERSRHYSIGPECEKSWPEIINYINETKGVFVP